MRKNEAVIPEQVIGINKVFFRAQVNMPIKIYKTFIYCLCQIRWKEDYFPEIIEINKKELAKVLNLNYDMKHLSVELFKIIDDMREQSTICIAKKDLSVYSSGNLIRRVINNRGTISVMFDLYYKNLFCNLSDNFVTLYSKDIFNFKNEKTLKLYEYLRLNSNTSLVNTHTFSIEDLKKIFKLPNDAYIKKNGKTDVYNFNKYVLEPVLNELNRCTLIGIKKQDGSLYKCKIQKTKSEMLVSYTIKYTIDPINVVSDGKTASISEKRIAEKTGKNKVTNIKNAGVYYDSDEQIDFNELEKKLLAK